MSLQAAIARKIRQHGGAIHGTGRRDTIPAPTRGWNTRDGLSEMKRTYAVKLQNYFPEGSRVRLRRGTLEHATGIGTGHVETLFVHESGSVSKLFAISSAGALHDATAAGAVEAALATGLTASRWQTAGFGGRTIMVSGEDAPMRIEADGTLETAHGWTGITTPANLFRVLPFKGRLMFLEKDTAKLWYGTVGGIQGALASFDLGQVHPAGGNAIALGTMSLDAGDGVDDLLVIFMDSGAALVYAGTDISSSTGWALVGVFHVGRLIGDRPLVKLGADLIAVTGSGYVPMRRVLQRGRPETLDLSDTISTSVTELVDAFESVDGWDVIVHSHANWLLINIPIDGGRQHAMNIQTRAWCEFIGMDAHAWAEFDADLYYGGKAGVVYQADSETANGADERTSTAGSGKPIVGEVGSAYHYFRSGRDKRFTMARSVVESDSDVQFSLGATTDFGSDAQLGTPVSVVNPRGKWNEAAWNVASWSAGIVQYREWQSVDREGTALSIRLRSVTKGARISLYATDVVYEETTGIQ